MRLLKIEVIAGAIKIRGHRSKELSAVLPVVRPAHLDAGDLRDGIGPIGRLEGSGEQVLLFDRLRAKPGIDAA